MYTKEMLITDPERSGKRVKAVVRNYVTADFEELIRIQAESFPPPYPEELLWSHEQLTSHVQHYPEGAICIEVDGELAGSMTSLRMQWDPAHPASHTWAQVTDDGYIRNHQPDGNTLYIVDLCVRPKYRKWGLAQLMMQAMYHLVIAQGMDRLLGAGRMPGYHLVADQLSAQEYLNQVAAGERRDPVISFLLRCGRMPVGVTADYLDDEESCNYAALMEWRNPFR
ncbi:GNAT family N-acetyltransferase [Paenibacillus amylolyticus]|uniref:GNAT family N-acetyltransferase n=1 Tax=Paenibacillus TaxID=44249 RepID=UPI0003E1F576|nr:MULTISPECIES: GNAT family N-acetyltransferase [Paenibacillus]ETT41322.1 N-acetyltransferase GCN5 [Paenibacillus sp. FSL R5-192]ETT49129.1 N-acetyltransferase GCN5 [Paenibacillus sp. FSL H7-689]OME97287.1 GNAT family N-acetyltransferase [Paenibacillus amylolyticus]OMF04433.1 GNAT family N-acetyltransferase [Paenibacillus amylolyticus]